MQCPICGKIYKCNKCFYDKHVKSHKTPAKDKYVKTKIKIPKKPKERKKPEEPQKPKKIKPIIFKPIFGETVKESTERKEKAKIITAERQRKKNDADFLKKAVSGYLSVYNVPITSRLKREEIRGQQNQKGPPSRRRLISMVMGAGMIDTHEEINTAANRKRFRNFLKTGNVNDLTDGEKEIFYDFINPPKRPPPEDFVYKPGVFLKELGIIN